MKIKASKKIIMAALALLMAVGLAAGSTFAWFSMNNKVTVDGMQVRTKVSSNLLIADDASDSATWLDDSKFTNTISQNVKGLLEPVSTANALDYYYTVDAKADGSKNQPVGSEAFVHYNTTGKEAGSDGYANKFSQAYDVTTSDANAYSGQNDAKAYVDYVIQMKATNTTEAPQYINLTKLNLQYAGAGEGSRAFRVAIFATDSQGQVGSAAVAGNLGGRQYAVKSSANFDGNVVSGTETVSSSAYADEGIAIATVPAGQTKYYKVVVRLWLEGQDTTCNNDTFLKLTSDWALDLEFTLNNATPATGSQYQIKPLNSSGVEY